MREWPATIVFAMWMTGAFDGREHAVPEDEFAEDRTHGRYRAVCERLLAPRALTAPQGGAVCAVTVGHRAGGTVGGRSVDC